MTADQLTAGMHLHGLVVRDVGGVYVEEVPVVYRARRRCRCGTVRRIDVTWSTGGSCRYQPGDRVDVLEVAS